MFVALTAFCLLFLAGSLAYFGRKRPGYSHIVYTISELAEAGSPFEKAVSLGVFLPLGLCMAGMAWWLRANEPAFLFTSSLAVGYVGAAFFPVDPDAPMFGTARTAVHNISAGASYVLAINAFEHQARELGSPYDLAKFLVMGFLVSLYVPGLRNLRGLLQRVVELAIFVGLMVCVV
jgi:hypothetical protein